MGTTMADANWWCRKCGWFPHRDDGWTGPMPTSWVKHPCKRKKMDSMFIVGILVGVFLATCWWFAYE